MCFTRHVRLRGSCDYTRLFSNKFLKIYTIENNSKVSCDSGY